MLSSLVNGRFARGLHVNTVNSKNVLVKVVKVNINVW